MLSGNVTVSSGGAHSVLTGDYIVIMRNVPINQTASFSTTGPNTVLLLERMGDKLATLSQQVNQIGSRSLRFENFEFLDGTLVKSARAGMYLAFDANGEVEYIPTGSVPSGFVSSITGTANEIAASASTGAVTLSLPSSLTFTSKTVTGGTFNSAAISATVVNVPGVGDSSIVDLSNASTTGVSVLRETNNQGARILMGTAGSAVSGTVAGISAAGLSYIITGANVATYPTAIAIATQSNAPIVLGVNNVETARFDASAFTSKLPVAVNQATLTNPAIVTDTLFRVTGADTKPAIILSDAFASSPVMWGRRAQGTSAAPAALTAGTPLLSLVGSGYGATAYSAGTTFISLQANQTWTDAAQGNRIVFLTTPDGSTSAVTHMTLKDSGILNIVNTPNYANNAAAIVGGLVVGDVYRNGDALQIVH